MGAGHQYLVKVCPWRVGLVCPEEGPVCRGQNHIAVNTCIHVHAHTSIISMVRGLFQLP